VKRQHRQQQSGDSKISASASAAIDSIEAKINGVVMAAAIERQLASKSHQLINMTSYRRAACENDII